MGGEDVIPCVCVHGRDPVSPLRAAFSIQLQGVRCCNTMQHSRCNVDSKRSADVWYVPDQIHEDDARSPGAGTEAKGSFVLPLLDPLDRRYSTTLSLRRRLPWCARTSTSIYTHKMYHKVSLEKTLFTKYGVREISRGGDEEESTRGRGDRGDRSRRVFTEPPRISHGKINLADTHREGDWTLDAVTGHGLQRLQQIACVKERTAINGCIIQYRGGERGGREGRGSWCVRE